MLYHIKQLTKNRSIYAMYLIWLYAGGPFGRHFEYIIVLKVDFLEPILW